MQNVSYPYGELRQNKRKPYMKVVDYSVDILEFNTQKRANLKGNAVDISNTGIGIKTDYPLMPGHTLWFNDVIDLETGVVKWSKKHNGKYRVGVELKANGDYSTHLEEEIKKKDLFVREDAEKYFELLDKATEQFNKELEDAEKRCFDPNENPEELLQVTENALNEVITVCDKFEQKIKDKETIRHARMQFHKKTDHILSKSYCINRARTWPQGSQGDYKTLEVAYRNTPLSAGIGYYLDSCVLNFQLAEAVRKRITKLEEILKDELLNRHQPSVLNIACGSCRELMGIVPEISASGAKVICIDNDNDALSFAQNRLSYTGILPHVEFYKYNALRMFDHELNMIEFGKQDIIYSVGFFDYLPSDFLVKLFEALYNLLNPGGKLIAAFKDVSRYRPQEYHWIVDWDGFLQRKEGDFKKIFSDAEIPFSALSEMRDDTGIIIFYIITK